MAESHSTATPEATKATSTAQPPVQDVQMDTESDRNGMMSDRLIRSVSGGSPETPPSQFAGALGGSSQVGMLRGLQRNYGNSYVGQVIQAKLTVGQSGDLYEQEADRVADTVMRMSEPTNSGVLTHSNSLQPMPIQRMCTECAEEEEEKIHTKESPGQAPTVTPALEARLDGTRGGGEPLPESVRGIMEPRFGADFGGVRVHTGSEADTLNRELGAQAFTRQRDIYFGAGRYSPETRDGQQLLAHELTHVVQQGTLNSQSTIQRQLTSEAPMSSSEAPMSVSVSTGETEALQPTFAETLPTGSRISSPAPPTGETIIFRGIILADDADYIRYQLEEIVRIRGRSALYSFPNEFEREKIANVENERGARIEELRREIERARQFESDFNSPIGVPAGVPWSSSDYTQREEEIASIERSTEEQLRLPRAIVNQLRIQAREIDAEIDTLFIQFYRRSQIVIRTLLDESERRVEAERIRYGIDRELISGGEYDYYSYSMEETVSSRGLAGASQDLAEKKEQLIDLIDNQQRLVRHVNNRLEGDVYEIISNQSEYDRLSREIEVARREYEITRASAESRYPVLAAFAEESGVRSLRNIAENRGLGRAETVGAVIYERLANIQRVREGLESGEVNTWTLPEIVTLTMADMGVRPNTMYARVIQDEVEHRSESGILDWILAGVALVLGIVAAIPTGGSSLAVAVSAAAALTSAGISGYMLAEHIQEYGLESALAATDFDKARSISQDEPSAFWLALDIVFFIADLGAAAQAFRRLAPLARQALNAGEESLQAMQTLRGVADDIDPRLGTRITDQLRRLRSGGDEALEVAGAPGRHEARAITEASEELAQQVTESLGGGAPTRIGNHTISATHGRLIRCSPRCAQLYVEYAAELADEPALRQRLSALERESVIADLTGNSQLAKSIEEEAADIADELESIRNLRDAHTYDAWNAELDSAIGRVDDAFVEYTGPNRRPSRSPLRRAPATPEAESAREAFNSVRDEYARRLRVPSGGQVHHAIELQVLSRYPGVFTPNELNDFPNMRGILTEEAGRNALHNSYIRLVWNRHYRRLDAEIARRGLQEGTQEYRHFVREYLGSARDEIDYLVGQYFSEVVQPLRSRLGG
ncbi:DUF4157 domain-containing protein [Calothrix sp. FACHB-1219]|uniref:eCIS core domain-containing protein n=1 Tax=unclassified Calothrix TaxID=2619626 RepID=UPI0016858AE2|nr:MULTISPECIES: DUF4157 domain-containing protein [unclassified Calothrix]MBD2207033.1 DUF4157 domain-containing protein [Calothrix sp. FACHB-168]MBD2221649.1 DUF4157 domain-containing protein [Calothrix sp. FACHB-1219]